MACRCPLIISSGAGTAELLAGGEDAGGLVVPPEDPVALAAALRRMLSNPGLTDRLGARARETVVEAASMRAVGRRMSRFLFR